MPRNDFNGDGYSDILWHHSNGSVTNWLNNGAGGFTGNHQNALTAVPLDWGIVGTGDFNGDNITDVLWRNFSNGAVTDWLGTSNGGFIGNHANAMTVVPLDWAVAGTGDFNGDGRDDVLWRDSNGVVTDWLGTENGAFVANHANAMTAVPRSWRIAGIGDFNGDGRDDVLWQSDGGYITNWLGAENGGFVANHAAAMTKMRVPVVAVGDFNGDHRDDIIVRDDWGFYSSISAQPDGSFDFNNYRVVADATSVGIVDVGDYNHDGLDDLLMNDYHSHLSIWSGSATGDFTAAPSFASEPSMWHMDAFPAGVTYWDF